MQLYRITTRPSDRLHVELDGRGVTVRSATRTLQHGWDGLTARCDAGGVLIASSQFSVSVAWRELSPPEAEANVRAAVAARGASGSPGVVTSAVRLTPELAQAFGVALLLAGPPADVRHLLVALLVSPLGARRLQALGVDLDALELACGPVDARWAAAASFDRSDTLGNPYAAPPAQSPPTWAFSRVVASAARLAAREPGGTSGEIRPDDLVGALVADVRAGAALRSAGWHGRRPRRGGRRAPGPRRFEGPPQPPGLLRIGALEAATGTGAPPDATGSDRSRRQCNLGREGRRVADERTPRIAGRGRGGRAGGGGEVASEGAPLRRCCVRGGSGAGRRAFGRRRFPCW